MTYRVIQWATGAMGKTCLRAVIDHPELELAGLYVYSEDKAGRDAGDIARRAPTGVAARRSLQAILDLDADVVIHAPRVRFPYDAYKSEICQLLASGKNVISINGHSYPAYHGVDYVREFERACNEGRSTLFGTGLNPGFVVDRVAAAATGICTDIDSIVIEEIYNCWEMPNAEYVFDIMGMGSAPRELDIGNSPLAELFNGQFAETVSHLAHRVGIVPDRIVPDHAVTPAPWDIRAVAGLVPAGTVAGTHWRWHALVGGVPIITLSINWIMDEKLPGYEHFNHWTIRLRGKPGLDITMNLVEPDDQAFRTKAVQYGVAGSVINSIPEVCEASPGILDFPLFAPYWPGGAG